MMKKHFIALAAFMAVAAMHANAQKDGQEKKSNKANEDKPAMNLVKVNLTSIAFKNYSLQYERVLSKRFSVAASCRLMPTTNLPFAKSIADAVGDDTDTKETIENLRMSNFAITPEARLYLGRGYARGFYIAMFYRYASYTVNHVMVKYDDTHSMDMAGTVKANTGGIMFGAQWGLSKHLCLDWWILGPHYGAGNGDLTGVSSKPLTQQEQDVLRQNLNDIDIPLAHKTVTVNAAGANMKVDGPWGGVRAGISLGVKF